MALKYTEAKNAEIKEKNYKLTDANGLYLLIHKNGSKYWRFKYYFAGKEKLLALGVFPSVSISQARLARDEAKLQLSRQIDPSQLKQSKKAALFAAHNNSFKSIADDWYERKKSELAASTLKKRKWLLEDKLYPAIGTLPISEISPPQILRALR